MDTCLIIEQIKDNLFDERHIFEKLQQIKSINKNLEMINSKREIENAINTYSNIKNRISSQVEITQIYSELFYEIEKFLGYHSQKIEMKEKVEKMEIESKEQQFNLNQQLQRNNIQLNSLNNISRHLNRSKKSMAILDLYGNFLIYDKLAKDQFEHIYRNLEKDTFFERIIQESNQRIVSRHGQDLCQAIKKNGNDQIVIKYTIFSEKSRKKFNKVLDLNSSSLSNIYEIENFMDLTKFEDIYFAYLQCLTSNVFLIDLSISHQSLTEISTKEQFDVNKKFLQEIQKKNQEIINFKAMLIVTRLSNKRQNLSIEGIKNDPLFIKFQVKTKRKISKIINRQLLKNVYKMNSKENNIRSNQSIKSEDNYSERGEDSQ